MRTYGKNDTMHRCTHLDVEVDTNGKVVGVWFRCKALDFQQTIVDSTRAKEMKKMYEISPIPKLHAIIIEDKVEDKNGKV